MVTRCLFCGGDRSEPDHWQHCDGRQGVIEAAQVDTLPEFNGDDYVPPRDHARLGRQYLRIFALMADGQWRTLDDIAAATGDPPASVSAQLRHMRKARFGGHTLNRRYVHDGLYEYQVLVNREVTDVETAISHHA